LEPTKTGLIGTDGIGQDTGIAPVILGSRDTVTIPEPVKLLGINHIPSNFVVDSCLRRRRDSFPRDFPWIPDGRSSDQT
jgi:hypothetical protein